MSRDLAPERVEALGRRHRLRLLYLFGSRAKGTAVAESDWDFAVLFETDPGADVFARMALLEQDLTQLVPGHVEVTMLHDAGAVFRFDVVSTGRCLFAATPRDRVIYEARACGDYADDAHRRRIYADGNRRYFTRETK
jgi:predicted nucleotidyltransferase